ILGGIDSLLNPFNATSESVVQEWQRMRAIPFNLETAITKGVYIRLRSRSEQLLDQLDRATEGFTTFSPTYISATPYMLPILQRLANIPSKAQLKERIGSVSDNTISAPAAEKLAQILNLRNFGGSLNRAQVLQSIEPALEGIVRDLVGKVLLESVVANALDDAKIEYKRENEYNSLKGVIYNFRADFVIPDENATKAFIEVRKSSSRHASLYAKDKMFSAINWKGENKELLAIIIVDGPWTAETLRVMTKIYDYVVPLANVSEVAEVIYAYVHGDRSKLRWLIDFAINPANPAIVNSIPKSLLLDRSEKATKRASKTKNEENGPMQLRFDEEKNL
ncbi:MAG TPA: hypothetical protein VGD98_20720, partial [Ktedonobacteraceae bacterium]